IWIAGVLYGIPASLFATLGSPVAIGRVITLILALVMCALVYGISRKVSGFMLGALLAVFALVASDAFFFSSHSARLDTLTGLAVLIYFELLLAAFRRSEKNSLESAWAFFLPFVAVLSLAV